MTDTKKRPHVLAVKSYPVTDSKEKFIAQFDEAQADQSLVKLCGVGREKRKVVWSLKISLRSVCVRNNLCVCAWCVCA